MRGHRNRRRNRARPHDAGPDRGAGPIGAPVLSGGTCPQAGDRPGGTRLDLMSEQPASAPSPINGSAINGSAVDRSSVSGSPLPAGLADALKRDSAGPGGRHRPAIRHPRGADAGLDGRRGAAPHPDQRAGDVLIRAPARSTGARETPPGTCNGSSRSPWTATAMRCWCGSTRSARPATPEPGRASTAASSTPSSATEARRPAHRQSAPALPQLHEPDPRQDPMTGSGRRST